MIVPQERPYPLPLRPWSVVGVALTASVAAALCLFKVQPIMPVLMESLQIGEAQAGLLMALFSLSGALLAVPGGIVISRFGLYKSGLLALVCLIVGSFVGVLGGTYAILLLSRLVEGLGMALLAITGVIVVAVAFPPEKRGAPIGIICLYVSLGELGMLNLAPIITDAWGWRYVWWFGIAFSLVALWLWQYCFRHFEKFYLVEKTAEEETPSLLMAFSDRRVWLLFLAYVCYIVAYIGVFAFWPSYLNIELSYSLILASSLVSLISLINIPVSFIAGAISDKLGSRKGVILFGMAACAGSYAFIPGATGGMLIFLLIVVGIFCITVPTVTFAAGTEIFADPGLSGITVSLLAAGQNLGFFIGPALMGILVENFGWDLAFQAMAGIGLLGIAILCLYQPKMTKKAKVA